MSSGTRHSWLKKIENVAKKVFWKLKPIPPPYKIQVTGDNVYAAVDLHSNTISLNPSKVNVKFLEETVAHELKHMSRDGLPGTLLDSKRHEAKILKLYNVNPGPVLNCVYDIVIDAKLHRAGFNIRGWQEDILSKNPVKGMDAWFKLNCFYKALVGVRSPNLMDPPKKYLNLAKTLVEEDMPREDDDNVIELAEYFVPEYSTIEKDISPKGMENFPVSEEMITQVLEIGIEEGLSPNNLKRLVGREYNVDEELANLAREKIFDNIIAFRELEGRSMIEVKRTGIARFRHDTSKLEPVSVASNPDDPRKWKVKAQVPLTVIPSSAGTGGFKEVWLIIDCSDSTSATDARGKRVIEYEKDIAASVAAFAVERGLEFSAIPFSANAEVIRGDVVEVMKRILLLQPHSITRLGEPARLLEEIGAERSLIAIVTDGEVYERDVELYTSLAENNRIIAVILSEANASKFSLKGIDIYTVEPDSAGNVIVSEFEQAIR